MVVPSKLPKSGSRDSDQTLTYSHLGVSVQGNFAPFPKAGGVGSTPRLVAQWSWTLQAIGGAAVPALEIWPAWKHVCIACFFIGVVSDYCHPLICHQLICHAWSFWSVKGRTITGQALKMLHLVWRVADGRIIFGVLEKGVVLPHLQVFFTPRSDTAVDETVDTNMTRVYKNLTQGAPFQERHDCWNPYVAIQTIFNSPWIFKS